RVFYASAQYYRTLADGRGELTAALVDVDGMGVDDAALLLVPRGPAGYGDVVRVADPAAGTETIDTSDSAYAVAVVINTRQTGDSLRPALCFGSVEEVAACRDAFASSGGAGGGGGEGGGGASPNDEEDVEDEGCSCRAAGGGETSGLVLLAMMAAATRLVRRRPRSRRRHG
ncbi:MAG TPA: MYXO-CTERM sorting domain-containing protein, partial [Gemmatimonadales bacterium]|nr:MYXO-CTERM sorting domain-containing protein [Gemmatimonadales bacterium]